MYTVYISKFGRVVKEIPGLSQKIAVEKANELVNSSAPNEFVFIRENGTHKYLNPGMKTQRIARAWN